MPVYIYRCPNNHETTLVHPIGECNLPHKCVQCKKDMRRVPQPIIHYNNPTETLLTRLDDSFRDAKARNDKWRQRRREGKLIS